jgi:phosphoadenylyl-sulfate reductase (thioredoxin)
LQPSTDPHLATLPAPDLLHWAIRTYGSGFAIITSFQDEGMAILDIAARIHPSVRVLTIDTGRLPKATRSMLGLVRSHYGLNVEIVAPDPTELARLTALHGPDLFLESVAKRRLCCEIRKVRPLARALAGLQSWASGLRRAQSAERGSVPRIDTSNGTLKLNPLADWTDRQLASYLAEHNVPRHPLYAAGYSSIGCDPCTRPAASGRAGRWWWEEGVAKECGLHFLADGRARRQVDILLEEILHA